MTDSLFAQHSNLDTRLRRFRVASRELFNSYFALPDPWNNADSAWRSAKYFSEIEDVMFRYMALIPENIAIIQYGQTHPEINVSAKAGVQTLPANINRELSSGYWDFELEGIPIDAKLKFVSFFDWSDLDVRDNEFVRVVVQECFSCPEIIGKQALVRPMHITFFKTRSF